MGTIFRYSLAKSRGAILGWGLGLFALGLLIVPIFDIFAEDQAIEGMLQLFESYPPEIFAFFGDLADMASPAGFLSIEYFSYMPIILGIYAIQVGSGLLAADEESGTLDLTMAHPLSRTALFLGRAFALLVTLVAILTIAWLGLAIPSSASENFNLDWGNLALPFLSLFAILFLFAAVAQFLSMILPSRRAAAMISGLLLVGGFFINGLSAINTDLEPIAEFLPLKYYQGGSAFDSFESTWFAGLLIAAILFSLLTWWRFKRRDIRVAGEGGLPLLDSLRRARKNNQRAAVPH
jgi:ABC-2 type transport system permease protein